MRSWIRIYSDLLSSRTIGLLTDSQFRTYIGVLLVIGETDDNGTLPTLADLSWRLHIDENKLHDDIRELIKVGLVAQRSKHGPRYIPNWGDFAPPLRPSAIEWYALRATVFERDDYTCQYCGQRGGRLECDHVIPISRGGSNELTNLVTACFECNRSKSDKTPEEWDGLRSH